MRAKATPKRRSVSYAKWGYIFIAPFFITFLLFQLVPLGETIYYSFFQWDGVNQATFIGFDNYVRLVTKDPTFKIANANGFKFGILITVYQLLLATIFAIAVSDKRIRCRKFFRTAYFIPVVLSVTVVCQLWDNVFNADNGLLNTLMKTLGFEWSQNWLNDRNTAIYTVAFVNAWQWMGYQFALIVAGIKSIGEDFYEAAEIDGATSVKAHWYITLPLLKDTFNFCLLISVTGGIKAFSEIDIMTGGGPSNATNTLTYIMYNHAFGRQNFGYGLTSASVLVLECLVIILVLNWLFKDRETPLFARKKGADLV